MLHKLFPPDSLRPITPLLTVQFQAAVLSMFDLALRSSLAALAADQDSEPSSPTLFEAVFLGEEDFLAMMWAMMRSCVAVLFSCLEVYLPVQSQTPTVRSKEIWKYSCSIRYHHRHDIRLRETSCNESKARIRRRMLRVGCWSFKQNDRLKSHRRLGIGIGIE